MASSARNPVTEAATEAAATPSTPRRRGSGAPRRGGPSPAWKASLLPMLLMLLSAPGQALAAGIPHDLSELAREPITHGNELELLIGGPEFYPRRLELIAAAEREIDLFMFLWCPDESGFRVAEALAAASQRGVRVRVAVDFFNRKGAAPIYDLLERAGVRLMIFNPPRWGFRVNQRMHEKIMVVDGEAALVGGANLCDEYMLENAARGLWQDYEVVVDGPAAGRIQERFDETWRLMIERSNRFRMRYAAVSGGAPSMRPTPTVVRREATEPRPDSAAAVLIHYQQPFDADEESERALEIYGRLFDEAQRRIVVHTPYMSPPPRLKESLIGAAGRGVEVQIITNSPDTNDLVYVFSLAARARYRRLIEAGVRLFESPDKTLHGKALVIDDRLAAVGSHNFTHRSFFSNNEIKVITDDAGVVDRLSAVFDRNMDAFREVTAEDLEGKEPGGLLFLLGRCAGRFF